MTFFSSSEISQKISDFQRENLFFRRGEERQKFCGKFATFARRPFFSFFLFSENTCAMCPWSLALASSIPVVGLEMVCPWKVSSLPWPRIFFCVLSLGGLGLEPCVLDSTAVNLVTKRRVILIKRLLDSGLILELVMRRHIMEKE